MNKKLIILLLLIVILPIGFLSWFGYQQLLHTKLRYQMNYGDLLISQLKTIDTQITNRLNQSAGQILAEFYKEIKIYQWVDLQHKKIREFIHDNFMIDYVMLLNHKRHIAFPKKSSASYKELAFLERVEPYLDDLKFLKDDNIKKNTSRFQWHALFWDNGIRLFFIDDTKFGNVIMTMDRASIMQDIIAQLPFSNQHDLPEGMRLELINAKGDVLYGWGDYEGTESYSSIPLSHPLSSWRIEAFVAPALLDNQNNISRYYIIIMVILLSLILGVIGWILFREYRRSFIEAGQKVSFVNQVSHELKTPLTNIRMYAELLESRMSEDSDKAKLGVITNESTRLGRLINNILLFAKNTNGSQYPVNKTPQSLKSLLDEIIMQFKPSFALKDIKIKHDYQHNNDVVNIDADVITQIIGNLFSNIEKYAANGKYAKIRTQNDGSIIISDNGIGIKKSLHDKVFQPFYRVRNDLAEGISGTGIGLSIARDLATIHGGTLKIIDTKKGTTFELNLGEDS